MQYVTIGLPDELVETLTSPGGDLSRTALEALATEAYREQKISHSQLRRLLGFQTRMEVDSFLKDGGVASLARVTILTDESYTHNSSYRRAC